MKIKTCLDCGKKKSKKGDYCKQCGYKHRTRPKGLKYTTHKINKGWFGKNRKCWNKGTKGLCKSNITSIKKGEHKSSETEFKKGELKGKNNINWTGDKVGYYALHSWAYRVLGKPNKCSKCKSQTNVQWANKSHKYIRNKNDWIALCFRCHRKYDMPFWGSIKKKYGVFYE